MHISTIYKVALGKRHHHHYAYILY